MGRKKRKITSADDNEDAGEVNYGDENTEMSDRPTTIDSTEQAPQQTQKNSTYAITSHSAEIITEDIYVSDGSESDGDGAPDAAKFDIILGGSRMGMMRRGLHHPSMLVQPNRQWSRQAAVSAEDADELAEQRRQQEEEELARLDPAERAARLLQEKQRKLEEAKELARLRESEENAGRDAMLFSKRTAFDIRFDQIEDKPWLRGNGDVSDFFNYGLTEEEWLEYSKQQLAIRQELIDARRQKRKPDPTIVPVTPREPETLKPGTENVGGLTADGDGSGPAAGSGGQGMGDGEGAIGPAKPAEGSTSSELLQQEPSAGPHEKQPDINTPVGLGGAWGAGAAPGSYLAKLIEEQERQGETSRSPSPSIQQQVQDQPVQQADEKEAPYYQDGGAGEYDEYEDTPQPSTSYKSAERPDEYSYGNTVEGGNYYGGGESSNAWSHKGFASEQYYNDGTGTTYHSGYPPPPPPPPPTYHQRPYRGRGYDRYGGRGGRGPPPPWTNPPVASAPWTNPPAASDYYGASRKRTWDGGDQRRRR